VSIYVGSPHQRQTIENLSKVINEANRYGIPVLGIVAVGRDLDKLRQPGMETEFLRYLGLACRITAEIGSHIVKAYYCKGFEKVVRGCPVPIVIAGGKKVPEEEALQFTSDAIRDGAKGMDMGRNIFQSENPVAMIKAVRAIVHENKTAKEAYEIYKGSGKK
jgi:putative autoinducer-2 (AI-2) aldolase